MISLPSWSLRSALATESTGPPPIIVSCSAGTWTRWSAVTATPRRRWCWPPYRRASTCLSKSRCASRPASLATLAAAAEQGAAVAQAGYVKVYDPAFEIAEREVAAMSNIKLALANHIHTDNWLHLRQFDLLRFDDVPEAEALGASRNAAVKDAVGDLSPPLLRTFLTLSGSVVHDLYSLRYLLGQPTGVVSADVFPHGDGLTLVLTYPNGLRGIVTWVDLAGIWHFDETLQVYGDDRPVLRNSPTGFARGPLTGLTIEGIDKVGVSFTHSPQVVWETAFRRELRHFHSCITDGTECKTSIAAAAADIGLIVEVMHQLDA